MKKDELQAENSNFTGVKRGIIYARVSTDEQAETGTSLENQVEKDLKYAEANGIQVPPEFIFREDYTGKVLDRPELNKVRALLKAGATDCLIVYRTNRLDRSEWGVNLLILLQELKMIGAELHYAESKRQINLNNPVEALMQSIEGWQSGEDRNNIVRQLVEGREKRIRQGGVIVAQRPPYGYDLIKEGQLFKLQINENEARIIGLIFHWYTRGEKGISLTIAEIQHRLNEMSIPIPSKSKEKPYHSQKRQEDYWGRSAIYEILKNETYAGTWHFGKRKRVNGKLQKSNRSEWIPVSVPAIVDRAIFEVVTESFK